MTAEDHIIAWIESSAPHYDTLLRIARGEALTISYHRPAPSPAIARSRDALELVTRAYDEMARTGDALDDYTSADLCRAAAMLCEWEEPK